jgi:menaquinol-cytochrome c reductase iron-sulfur subunit
MERTPLIENVPKAESSGRRSFFGTLLGMSIAIVGTLLAIPLVRFSIFPLRKGTPETDWSDVGPMEEFASITEPVAKTITLDRRDAWQTTSSQTAVYVLPSRAGQLRILSPICPHLGCSVHWEGSQDKFICPCHSGSFTADGERIAGPPPRSMDALESKVENGVLKVRYQYFRQLVPNKETIA